MFDMNQRYTWHLLLFVVASTWSCHASDSTTTAESDAVTGSVASTPDAESEADLTPLYAPDRILEVSIDLEAEAWESLRFERRSMTEIFGANCEQGIGLGERPYNYYPANVTVDGITMNNVGLRTKGLLGSINPARPSLKVKLHEYEDDITFEHANRFTFNNQNQDASRIRTCLSYYVFAAADVPASLCNFAHVTVNGRDMGVYANVEPLKKPMLARNFGDDSGNLYEGTAADIRAGGFMARIEKKTNEEANDWSDIHQLRDAIEAPDETFREELEAILDLDAFITFWATESLVGHWDGFTGNRNNYFTYNNPENGKFYFIPWGPDGALVPTRGGFTSVDTADPISVMTRSKLAYRLWGEADIRIRYQERMEELLDTVWKEDELLAEVERLRALIGPSIRPANADDFTENLESIREYIRTRGASFRDEFENGIPEVKTELEQNYSCMSAQGTMTASVSTTWGSAGAENPFSTGNGSFQGTIYGFDMNFLATGATAGWAENSEPGDIGSLFVLGTGNFEEFFAAFLTLPPSYIHPYSSVPIDGKAVSGMFVRFVPSAGDFQLMGFIGGTGIEFGQAGTNEGDLIEANINLEIWGGGGGGNNYGTPVEPPDDFNGTPGEDDAEDT